MTQTNQEIIDELFRRTRIALSEDDPALIILTLARIAFENQSDITGERISVIASGFEHTAEKTATSIIESLNKAAGILQLQLNEIEAAKKSVSLPELLEKKYSPPGAAAEESFKERFFRYAMPAGVFALGSFFAFFVCGFMWVFFKA